MENTRNKFLVTLMVTRNLFLLTSCKTNEYQLEVDIELGYDSTVKLSDSNPLKVTIHNYGEAFHDSRMDDYYYGLKEESSSSSKVDVFYFNSLTEISQYQSYDFLIIYILEAIKICLFHLK